MRRSLLPALAGALLLVATSPAEATDAGTAFDQLKTLAGDWRGTPEAEGMEAEAEAEAIGEVHHEFRLSANDTVVMETMSPGTPHEMINMYHLDGEELMLTHYCAGGNQPQMKLNRETSTASKLVFDFMGGTNLDPAVDPHIHSAILTLNEDGSMVSSWTGKAGGEEAGKMTFYLARSE